MPGLSGAALLILSVASVTVALQVVATAVNPYGYFRDELYYIACGEHLAFGYVDHPALIPAVTRFITLTVGDSLEALRLLPALAIAGVIALTGVMARELGGGWRAVALASIAAAISPTYLLEGGMLAPVVFDTLVWAATAFFLLRLLRTGDARYWLAVGATVGVGVEVKHNAAFLAVAVVAGVLLTSNRRYLRSRYLWAGAGLALLLALPQLLWQVVHGFPTLEFARSAAGGKNAGGGLVDFPLLQVISMHPLTLPVWLTGLGWLLISPGGRLYRMLGLVWLVPFVLFLAQGGAQSHYLAPAYPALLAAGAVVIERWRPFRTRWLPATALGVLVLGGLGTLPLGVPILPVHAMESYTRGLGLDEMEAEEGKTAVLPQWFADRFGWESLTATVASVYASLPEEERARAVLLTRNYGEAGAIDFFGGAYGLPRALSGHNNYHLWGPGDASGDVVIALGISPDFDAADGAWYETFLRERWASVEQVATVTCDHCTNEENNLPVYLLRRPLRPLSEIWDDLKHYG